MFFKNKKYVSVIIILIIALVLVYFSAINRNNTRFIDNAAGFIIQPVSSSFAGAVKGVSGFFDYFKNKKELINLNNEMDNKILVLEHENSSLKAYEYENERLRNMLDFKDKNPQFKLAAAKVVSKDNSNYYSTFLINKGTESGVKVNMPVTGARGLIGYIIESGNGFSRVRTIIDGGSSAGCIVTRTQNSAVTEGDTSLSNNGLMRMIYVSKEMNLIKGDIIETSGMGQIYPLGIIIGRVEEIKNYSGSESQYAIIKPVEDFDTIHEVFVITSFEKTGALYNE